MYTQGENGSAGLHSVCFYYSYSQHCPIFLVFRQHQFAIRATLLSTETLKAKDMYLDAAAQFMRMTGEVGTVVGFMESENIQTGGVQRSAEKHSTACRASPHFSRVLTNSRVLLYLNIARWQVLYCFINARAPSKSSVILSRSQTYCVLCY